MFEEASVQLEQHELRLPERCHSVEVSRKEILDDVEKALDSGHTISLIAGVSDKHGRKHGTLLWSGEHSRQSLRSEKRAFRLVLPVLSAVFGGHEQLFEAMSSTREFSGFSKQQRRSLRNEGRVKAVSKIASQLSEAHVLAYGGLLLSKAQMQTLQMLETHELEGKTLETKSISRSRIDVGGGVKGPKLRTVRKLQQFIDNGADLNLGELVDRGPASKTWPSQGTARVRDVRRCS